MPQFPHFKLEAIRLLTSRAVIKRGLNEFSVNRGVLACSKKFLFYRDKDQDLCVSMCYQERTYSVRNPEFEDIYLQLEGTEEAFWKNGKDSNVH